MAVIGLRKYVAGIMFSLLMVLGCNWVGGKYHVGSFLDRFY